MNETRYLISEAAKLVQVESHVLRYWEEELERLGGMKWDIDTIPRKIFRDFWI